MTYQPTCPNHEDKGVQYYKMYKDKAVVKSIDFETVCDGMRFKTLVKATIAVPCEWKSLGRNF